MEKIRIPIVGIRHHAFKDCLEEMYASAVGRMVVLCVDADNVAEKNAVMATLQGRCLGFVRSGKNREVAYEALRASGKTLLMSRVVEVNREQREVWVELSAKSLPEKLHHEEAPHLLTGWQYDGPVLHHSSEEVARLCHTSVLKECLCLAPKAWDDELECLLQSVCDCGWMDMSGEAFDEMSESLEMLTALGERDEQFAQAARRLQYAMDYMGSPETQQRRMEWLRGLVHSDQMQRLLREMGQEAERRVQQLPARLLVEFDISECDTMARLWYFRLSRSTVWAVLSLLATRLWLDEHPAQVVPSNPAPAQQLAYDLPLPAELNTMEVRELWECAKRQRWVDEGLQPLLSQKKSAILASVMADALGLNPRWAAFEKWWKIDDLSTKLSQAQNCGYYSKTMKEMENMLM